MNAAREHVFAGAHLAFDSTVPSVGAMRSSTPNTERMVGIHAIPESPPPVLARQPPQ